MFHLKAHPGTNVTIINMLHGRHSLDPMWHQVAAFGQVVNQISNENPDGIHLIGYSQGGLISRGIVESFSGLNIKSFVSLSSPQGGQYGGKNTFIH
jgi:palmitoyl-protein thioesterase